MTHESAPGDSPVPRHATEDDGPAPLDELDVDLESLLGAELIDQEARHAPAGGHEMFAALVAEHESEQIGPLWLAEIRRLCAAAARRYPARAYNDTKVWDAGAIEDLTMDAVERLLVKGQIAYICTVAQDLDSARKLLWRQIKFTLSTRRRPFRTVVDNLLQRAVEQLELPPYERAPGPLTAWRLVGSEFNTSQSSDLGPLVVRLRKLPRRPGHGTERASSVWSTDVLKVAVADVVESFRIVDRSLLDEIFRDALTALMLGELETDTEGSEPVELSPGPEDETMVADAVRRALTGLNDEERTIVQLKLDERTDGDIAGALDVSRQTVDKRKRAAFEKLRRELGAIPDHLDDQVVDMIRAALAGGST